MCPAAGTIWQNIYFGTNPDPRYFGYSDACRCFPLPLLQPETTYYWRIAAGTHTSPVWSFTTGTSVGVETVTWGRVRSLYR